MTEHFHHVLGLLIVLAVTPNNQPSTIATSEGGPLGGEGVCGISPHAAEARVTQENAT